MVGSLKFTKMHGLGNDWVIIDLFDKANSAVFMKIKDEAAFARRVCDRHFGIGADGILLASPSKNADCMMRILNADGSEAEMSGNGIRCIAKFVLDNGYAKNKEIAVETISGVKKILVGDGMFRVDMGQPGLQRKDMPMNGKADSQVINEPLQLKYTKVRITAVSVGNPHAVLFVDDPDFDIEDMGKEIENHHFFPKRVNVEFVHVVSNGEIDLDTWERGVGETLACGTGACASVVASSLNGKTGRKVKVNLRGGELLVEWAKDNHVYMTGPATYVFSGTINVF